MGRKYSKLLLFLVVSVVSLVFVSSINLMLFHVTIELATIFIGLMIYIIAINSTEYSSKGILLPLGIAYLFVCILDFAHVLTYDGMMIVGGGTNVSNQYWIAARLFESLAILFALLNVRFKLKVKSDIIYWIGIIYTASLTILISNMVLPRFYNDGVGQTSIKITMAIVIMVIYMISLIIIEKQDFKKQNKRILQLMILLKLGAEVLFTQYTTTYEIYAMLGHLLKFLSYSGFYVIFVSEVVHNPYSKIFSVFKKREEELTVLAERDSLTGIYNHSTTFSKTEEMIERNKGKNHIAIVLIDVDDFKIVNDTYGHQVGDEVLIGFAQMLLTCDVDDKVVGRYGGDEFIIAFPVKSREDIDMEFSVMKDSMSALLEKLNVEFTFSAGVAFYEDGDETKDLIYKADIKMYEAKRQGKNCFVVW